jgi:hypothetical protein
MSCGPGARIYMGIAVHDVIKLIATEDDDTAKCDRNLSSVWKLLTSLTHDELTQIAPSAFLLSLKPGDVMIVPPMYLLADHSDGFSVVVIQAVVISP